MGGSHLTGLSIDEDDFEALPLDKKLNVLYKNSEEMNIKIDKITAQFAIKRKTDATLSAAGGIIGGIIAMIGKWTLFGGRP